MSGDLFRREALDAHSRIGKLQNTMHVTNSLTRAALIGLAVLLCGAAVWSRFVHVPVRVNGTGVLVDTSGELLKPVRAVMDGIVETIVVNEGDHVTAGQVVARVRLPDRINALQKADRDLAALEQKARETEALQALERDTEEKTRNERRNALEDRIANMEQRLAWQRDIERDQIKLMELGSTTRTRVVETRVLTQQIADQLASAKSDLLAMKLEPLNTDSKMERERLMLKFQIQQLQSEMTALRSELERGTVLKSTVSGTVAELSAERNGLVTAGQPVLSVIPEDFSGKLEALTYVSMADGKLVQIGDEVLIRPSSLPVREQGRVRGTVMEISEAPITERALTRILGNSSLVQQVTGAGAPFAVRIALHRDPSTPSNYVWTSGEGPDMRMTPGTPVSSRITVERETLLSLAMPALRRLLGAND
jgi:HlyD family secretion protein